MLRPHCVNFHNLCFIASLCLLLHEIESHWRLIHKFLSHIFTTIISADTTKDFSLEISRIIIPFRMLLSRNFGAKCSKCSRSIAASDWVRRARELVFHLACFACDQCGRQLSTGEQFALLDDRVLCKSHYNENTDGGGSTSSDGNLEINFFNWIN